MAYELPPLPYEYDALEPSIDEQTMRVHHDKHHATYVTNLNAALEGTEWADRPLEQVLDNLDLLPESARTAVRNNGGGHANHSLFWESMSPDGGGEPDGELAAAISDTFDSLDEVKTQVNDAGMKRFGSGWTWLIHDGTGLAVVSTPNQDSPADDRQTRRSSASTSGSTLTTSSTRTAGRSTWRPGGASSTGLPSPIGTPPQAEGRSRPADVREAFAEVVRTAGRDR